MELLRIPILLGRMFCPNRSDASEHGPILHVKHTQRAFDFKALTSGSGELPRIYS